MDKLALELNFLKKAFDTQASKPVGPETVNTLVTKIADTLAIVAGAAAVIMLIYAGIQYITAGGNTEQATKARQGIINSLIGIAIVILSYGLVLWVAKQLGGQR